MEMLNQKIEKFRQSAINMANSEAEKVNDEIEKSIDDNVISELKEYELEKQKEYQKKIKKLEHQFNSKVFEENIKAKQIIMQRQRNFEDSIKKEFCNMANSFVNSDKYCDYLIGNIKNAFKNIEIENGNQINIYITKRDKERFGKKICEQYKCNVYEISDNYIGGAICENNSKKVLVNNTILDMYDL